LFFFRQHIWISFFDVGRGPMTSQGRPWRPLHCNDRISSHCMRFALTLRTALSRKVAHVIPASTKSLVTVLIETPATHEIERRDEPSTSRVRIWTRFSNGSLFMLRMI